MGGRRAAWAALLALVAGCSAQPVSLQTGDGAGDALGNETFPQINATLLGAPYDIVLGDWAILATQIDTNLNTTGIENITITWTTGDGSKLEGNGLVAINYTYMEPGLYELCIDALDPISSTASIQECTNVTVRVPGDVGPVPVPMAVIGGPYGGRAGVPVIFNGSESYVLNQGDRTIKYIWAFGENPLPFLETGQGATTSTTPTSLATPTLPPETQTIVTNTDSNLQPTGQPQAPIFGPTTTDGANPPLSQPGLTDTQIPPDQALPTTSPAGLPDNANPQDTNTVPPTDSTTSTFFNPFASLTQTDSATPTQALGPTNPADNPFGTPTGNNPFVNPFSSRRRMAGATATSLPSDASAGGAANGVRRSAEEEMHALGEWMSKALRRRSRRQANVVLASDATNTIDGLVVTDSPIVPHIYDKSNLYTACLVLQVGEYRSSPNCTRVTIYEQTQAPVAVPGYNNNVTQEYEGIIARPITFDASESWDPQNMTLTYIWLFGDEDIGQPVNPLSAVVQHAYKFAGTYQACLVVSNGELNSNATCVNVVVRNQTRFGAGPNLLQNADFSQGRQDWTAFGNEPFRIIDTGCLNDTGNCLRATNNSGAFQAVEVNQAVTRAMRFQGWTRTSESPELLMNEPYFRIMLTRYDNSTEDVAVSPTFTAEDDTPNGTSWLQTSIEFTPAEPVMSATLFLLQSTMFGRVFTVFDDLLLQEL